MGESLTGYPLRYSESKMYPGTYSILLQDEEGGVYYVNTAGNVKYIIADGKMPLGVLTKITREDDRFVKKANKNGSHFKIEIDEAKTLEGVVGTPINISSGDQDDAAFNALGADGTKRAPTGAGGAASTQAAVERANVKAQAKSLTAQANQRK